MKTIEQRLVDYKTISHLITEEDKQLVVEALRAIFCKLDDIIKRQIILEETLDEVNRDVNTIRRNVV